MTGRLDRLSQHTRDFLVIAVLALASVAFLANVLFTDQVLVGDNLARDYPWAAYADEELLSRPTNGRIDPLHQYYEHRVIAAEMVRAGTLPLWNPYYLSGTPFLATEPLAGLLYPPNLVYYLIDPLQAFGISACLHLFLAGLFMYLYLRRIGLDRVSALFGAISFEVSGYFVINLMWLSRVCTAAWAPLLFFSFEGYWREKRLAYALLLAFGLGMSLLAGTPPVVVFVMLALGLYIAARVLVSIRERGLKESALGAAVVVTAVCLGTLLAAVQLLPTYEATPFLARAHWSYEEAWDTGRSPLSLATALVPEVLVNYWRPNIYVGVLPLLLAFWALVFRRNLYVVFFGAVALLSLSLFLNIPDLLYRLLYLIPVFRVGRLMEVKIVYAFSVSVLAGWGFSSLAGEVRARSRSRMLGLCLILLVLAGVGLAGMLAAQAESIWPGDAGARFWAAWDLQSVRSVGRASLLLLLGAGLLLLRGRGWLGPRSYGSLAILLVAADMFYFGWKLNPPQKADELFFETGSTRFLGGDSDLFRIIRGPGGGGVLPPNTGAVYGVSDAQGYSSLVIDYYGQFMDLIEPGLAKIIRIRPLSRVESLASPLLDLLNVKYVLTEPSVSQELVQFDAAHDDIELVYDGEIRIYENRNVLPRAFVVHDFKVLSDKEDIFTELANEEFDPGAYVVLEEEPSNYSTADRLSGGDSTARVMDYGPNKVIIEVYAASDGFLVLSDLYYNGWKAFVDGENEKVYKADYVFRAVRLAEGQHTVEFVFDPLSFQIGWRISAMTAGIMGVSLLIGYVRRPTRDRGQGSPVPDPGERSPERAAP
ncbi:MAG TPA: YfhO family protein [Anaerolineae bacterium]|nr:YfhO family protein [Anaerolineae bacterium]